MLEHHDCPLWVSRAVRRAQANEHYLTSSTSLFLLFFYPPPPKQWWATFCSYGPHQNWQSMALLNSTGPTKYCGERGTEQGKNMAKEPETEQSRKKKKKKIQRWKNSHRSSDNKHLSVERCATRTEFKDRSRVWQSTVSSWYSIMPHYPPAVNVHPSHLAPVIWSRVHNSHRSCSNPILKKYH